MMSTVQTKTEATTLRAVFGPILSKLARLVQHLRHERDTDVDLEGFQDLLETLPLSTDQFGLACNRLRNAQRYLRAKEPGAAKWELSTLREYLKMQLELEAAEPKRRRRR